MFDNGDKVVVIGSTVKKNKTGPKKGSLGYVLGCSLTHTLYSDDFHSIKRIYRVKVLFIRYGFEKKYRLEAKTVVSTITGTYANINRKEFIKALSIDTDKQTTEDSVITRLKMENIPMCILVPANRCSNTSKYDDEDMIGWIVPTLLNEGMTISDISTTNSPINQAINMDVIRALASIGGSSSIGDMANRVKMFLSSVPESGKREIVKTLTLIKYMSLNRDIKYVEDCLVGDITNLYEDGCSFKDVLVELRSYLLTHVYTDRYPHIEGVALRSLYEMNRVYERNDIPHYHKVIRTINNTRNMARSLGCLFSRSSG